VLDGVDAGACVRLGCRRGLRGREEELPVLVHVEGARYLAWVEFGSGGGADSEAERGSGVPCPENSKEHSLAVVAPLFDGVVHF
jgi:hypothetical protein